MYEPNDSPFGHAYAAFLEGEFERHVEVLSPELIDEFIQIAEMKLDTPIYASDGDLGHFADALRARLKPNCIVCRDPEGIECCEFGRIAERIHQPDEAFNSGTRLTR
jgi:hypothetical protein